MSNANDAAMSGDYILPVGMTDLQKKVTSAVVSSNFSEILSFFDGKEQARHVYKERLMRMMEDLNLVATHPYLLLLHMQPSLAGKRAPASIESMSGKFQSLVTLTKKFNKPDQHVAIVCAAGHATDLVESVLSDRSLNITRYSAQSQQKIYKKENTNRRGATFHLMPSELKDLKQAVYAAFDVMIVLDNTFDANSKYGLGLRAQLRDPIVRRPHASVIRLVPLNSAQHIQLDPNLTFSEQIASTVVLKKHAGAMPSIVKQFYAKDMSPINAFVNNPDGPFPLPGLPMIKHYGPLDVEKALYLDDEDQYQVDFVNKKVGGRRRAAHADADELETGEDDSGSDSGNGLNVSANQSVTSESHANANAMSEDKIPSRKRRIVLEEEAVTLCNELTITNPLSTRLLVEFNDSLTKCRLEESEVSSHRYFASERELTVETQREQMQELSTKVVTAQKESEDYKRKYEKVFSRNQVLERDIQDTSLWWKKIAADLSLGSNEAERSEVLAKKISDLQAAATGYQKSLEIEKDKYERLLTVSKSSSEYADSLTKERDNLALEVSELKAKLEKEPIARHEALEEQISLKASEVKSLKAELENLKESVKIQLANDKQNGRSDRRTGRVGRGSGLNKHNS